MADIWIDGNPPIQEPDRSGVTTEASAAGPKGDLFLDMGVKAPATSEALRVVHITHTAALSGAELALLRQVGWDPRIRSHVIVGEEGPLVERLRQTGTTVSVVPLSPRTGGLRRHEIARGTALLTAVRDALRWTWRLRREIEVHRPHVVETDSMKAHFCGGLAARSLCVPHLWRAHDRISAPYVTGLALHATRVALRLLPTHAVANSRSTAQTLRLPARRVSVIPPPVPDPGPRHRTARDFLVVGHVGRLAPWKGQDVFLRAFAEAFPKGPEEAVVIGSPLFGEEEYAHHLADIARDLGIARRVRFSGFVEAVAAELSDMDILVHSSTIPEPFGQVVIEGMSAGLAVIASNSGGPAEVISHGRNGLLTAPEDVRALAECMRRLADDSELRLRLGGVARQDSERFRPGVVIPEMAAAYRSVAKHTRDERPR